ncbi:MarR family transcriptional regulator [Labedella phragmitis]|uniref:MarR family transcriptional regulator n=1 Tax=Labedella phragmitis TaxID=2498849 RepID=A0A3S3ZS68_9MICO|nr:MarR family winged helix-turn-helix transcriptional regulator [Labedella phragmitis]RWZ52488.1 MarR family transcriptional regulator [Labedella phragmitis]
MTTSGTRKTPTSTELAAWREYIEAAEEMRRAVSSAMQDQSGVSSGDYSVLLALSEADGHRLRSSALADDIGWERSRLSHHLGRMEKRGLVARDRCGEDNRGAWIAITAEGSSLFRTASAAHFRVIRRLFVDALDDGELEGVRAVSAALRRHVRSTGGNASQDD